MDEVLARASERWLPGAVWLVAAAIILVIILAIILGFRHLLTGGVKRSDCTEPTVGFIRSAKQTNLRVNERPQFILDIDAVAEDGSLFRTTVRKVFSFSQIDTLTRGRVVPIKFNPANASQAIWDNKPDDAVAQERLALHQSIKHPGDLSYERRMDIAERGVTKKALLENFRLTGKEEGGDWEAEVTVQITEPNGATTSLTRKTFVTNDDLYHLIKGMYIDIRLVPGREREFIIQPETSSILYE